jgi:hypothetical protein
MLSCNTSPLFVFLPAGKGKMAGRRILPTAHYFEEKNLWATGSTRWQTVMADDEEEEEEESERRICPGRNPVFPNPGSIF